MKYIDIHTHLYFPNFDKDREEVIKRTIKNHMGLINVGTNLENSDWSMLLAQKHEHFYATVGIHPSEISNLDLDIAKKDIISLASHPKVVAIGECGLDYFKISDNTKKFKEAQKQLFEMQIEIALEMDLPLMIHCRSAYEDAIEILKKYQERTMTEGDEYFNKKLRGNFHFFAGSAGILKDIIDLDFTVSYTGVITFAPQYEKLVEQTPIDKLHVETDAPFAAPKEFRGQRNEPLYCLEVIKKIADIKKIKMNDLADQLLLNAEKLFNIKIK